MATTFGFQLATSPNKKGFYPVVLRITQNRKQKKVRTDLEVKKENWNQRAKNYQHFRKSIDAKKKNDELKNIIRKYEATLGELKEEGNAASSKIIEEATRGEISPSFMKYAKDRTKELLDTGNIRNYKRYNGLCNKLADFLKKHKKGDMTFKELTPSLLADFDTYLHRLKNERSKKDENKKLSPNTIAKQFDILRTLVNRAIELGLMRYEDNPFHRFKYQPEKTTIKEKLDVSEIEAIKNLKLEKGSMMWHCRNYFLFSFYCAGIRAGDLIQLRWLNITKESRLNYQMDKNGKERDLELVPQARQILHYYYKPDVKPTDYIFPLLDSNAVWAKAITLEDKERMETTLKEKLLNQISSKNVLINRGLGLIAKNAGITKKVSLHIARHSFAKIAKDKGIDNLSVKSLLAHSSLSVTERYMGSFDTVKNDKALESVFEHEPATEESIENNLLKTLQGMDPEVRKKVLKKLSK